jgi:hypothetical protein
MSDSQGRLGPDWEALQRGLSGLVALPGPVACERARPPFIAWFDDLQPQAVVSCAAAGDAAQALASARRYGLAVAVRSGGGQVTPGAAEGQATPAPTGDASRRCHRFTKSEFFDRPLPGQALAALAGHLAGQRTPGQDRSVMFAPWAAAYNQQPTQATAFAHRSQLFLVEHEAVTAPGAPAAAHRAARQWVTTSRASVHRWGSGRVYPNFPDPGLTDWGRAYYGGNVPRLRTVKARYDPEAVFGSRQPLLAR